MDYPKPPKSFDFTPVLLATVLAFVVVAGVEFSANLAGGERGLLRFEKACPIYTTAHHEHRRAFAKQVPGS